MTPVNMEEDYCPLCAVKHVARAESLLAEAKLGYPKNFWRCLGELSLAEDHLLKESPALAAHIREHRKRLETDPAYKVPFGDLLLTISSQTGYDLSGFWEKASPEGSRGVPFEP